MATTAETLSTASAAEPTVFTTPVILVISLGAYVFAVVVLLIIKEILVSRGKCTENVCPCCDCCGGQPAKRNDCLNSWCLQWAECCNCCGPPDVATAQWWDQCCARRKGGIDCYDVILCQCCNDCNVCADLCCDPKTPLCNCQGCGNCFESCSCQCSIPECQKIDCCCCEIQLKGGQQLPPGGYPNQTGGYPSQGGGYSGGYGGGGYGGGDGYGRGGYNQGGYGDRGYDERVGRDGRERWENGRYGDSRGGGRGGREDRSMPLRDQPRGGNPFLASGYNESGTNGDAERGEAHRWHGEGGGGGGDGRNSRYDDSRF